MTTTTNDDAPRRLLTREELAERLHMHPVSVSRLAAAGEIPSVRIGSKALRFYWPAVCAALGIEEGARDE